MSREMGVRHASNGNLRQERGAGGRYKRGWDQERGRCIYGTTYTGPPIFLVLFVVS